MAAVMHLTVLVSLFAVAVCKDITTAAQSMESTTRDATPSNESVTQTNIVTTSTVKTTKQQTLHPTTKSQNNTEATKEPNPSSTPPITSPQTPNRTNKPLNTSSTEAPATNHTSNETDSSGWTSSPTTGLPSVTMDITFNTTSAAPSHEWGNDSFETNAGLVAILCIFCIILALTLVVVIMKCFKSPSSNFERLDDVPMNKVSEESPFARYSK